MMDLADAIPRIDPDLYDEPQEVVVSIQRIDTNRYTIETRVMTLRQGGFKDDAAGFCQSLPDYWEAL